MRLFSYHYLRGKRYVLLIYFITLIILNLACSNSATPDNREPLSTPKIDVSPVAENKNKEAYDAKAGITDNEILIGSCAALTGPAQFLGTETITGAKAYLNYINDQGGVNGRKIRLISYDDGYEPTKAIECFNQLLKDRVFAGSFFVGTPTAAKHAPMAESNRVPIVGLFTGAQLLRDPFKRYIINVRASYFDETKEQIDNLWNSLGMKKIAVIYQDDAFGVAVLEGVKSALKKYNSAPVGLGSFSRNTLDVDNGIAQARDANPDAVILVGAYASVAEVIKRSRRTGWKPLFITVSFVGSEALIKALGDDAEGTVITQVIPPYTSNELPAVNLYNKLLKKYSPDAQPNFTSFEGFVDAMVLVEGLKRAGKDLTRDKLISSIESIKDFDMGLGSNFKLNYSETSHQGFNQVINTVVRKGQIVSFTDWKTLQKN